MNKEYIKNIIEHIESVKHNDPGLAHGWEDCLREEFVKHVSKTAKGELAELAKLVLQTSKIDFPRWCA